MARLDNWQNNLSAAIEEARNKPFHFQTWNCLVWASEAIKAVKGEDILAKYTGKYKTEKGAAKLLRQIDKVETSQELLKKKLECDFKPVAFARPGDIVLVNPTETNLDLPADIALFGPVPGVCNGAISYFVGENGLIEVETLILGKTLWVS